MMISSYYFIIAKSVKFSLFVFQLSATAYQTLMCGLIKTDTLVKTACNVIVFIPLYDIMILFFNEKRINEK